MTSILLWSAMAWILLFAVGFRFVRRRKWLAAGALVPAVVAGTLVTFFSPPTGAYDPMAARYWVQRAAGEADQVRREEHLRRVALSSASQGWFIASQAIGDLEDRTQRCRLRTMLANLPAIQNRERLGREASEECNATLPK